MRVYLASWFESKEERKKERQTLLDAGIECTASWLDEKPFSETQEYSENDANKNAAFAKFLAATADLDVADAVRADVVVCFTTDRNLTDRAHTGGRHFESGIAYGVMLVGLALRMMGSPSWIRPIRLITVGPKENVFHHLPRILNFPTWEEALVWLKAYKPDVDELDECLAKGIADGSMTEGAVCMAENLKVSTTVN